ncbi:major facilitator superfamily domain-containing protein 6-like [Centruroides vittatus]|uniref:major facilitator superfamily domain-containing protein 6-like n=1 Tax=Centruroides vittatus TaxID=120091 RepID=UPI00350EC7AB
MPLTFFQDLKNKQLLPIKLLLFLQAAGDMALYPFITLHMKYLGISITDIGIQFAVSPVATLIATPLVGLLADKIGNFKIMLSISLILCAVVSQLFMLVPAVETITLPSKEIFLACNLTEYERPLLSVDHLNDEETFVGCKMSCRHHNSTSFDLCFVSSTTEVCISDAKFDFGISNRSVDREFFYNNNTYSKIMCSVNSNWTLCGVECLQIRNNTIVDTKSKAITFWSYLLIRVALFVIIATEMSLLKAAILTILDKVDSDYGFQRLWASVAVCVVPPITGIIMDQLKKGDVEVYAPCFYIYGGMKVLMAIIALIVSLDVKPPTLHVWKNLGKLLKNVEVDTLLFYCTFIGSCWGFLETFFLWFMEGLGASKSLMGLTFTVGAVSGIPVTLIAGALARKLGHVPLIVFGLIVYCGRFIGYSFIETPYEALGLEALECITMGLMMITLTTYANLLAGNELVATMQATWASLHFSVGRALGSVIGGFLMEQFGTRKTYQIFAASCATMGALYLLIYKIWFAKNHQKDKPKEETEHKKTKLGKDVSLALANIITEEKKSLEKQSDSRIEKNSLDKANQKNSGKNNLAFESTDL